MKKMPESNVPQKAARGNQLYVDGKKLKGLLIDRAGTLKAAAQMSGHTVGCYYKIIQSGTISASQAEHIQSVFGIRPQEYAESPLLEKPPDAINYSRIAGAVYAGMVRALKEAGLWKT